VYARVMGCNLRKGLASPRVDSKVELTWRGQVMKIHRRVGIVAGE